MGRSLIALAGVCLLCASLAIAADGPAEPVPPTDERTLAETQVREVYKADISEARASAAKAELARKLIRQSAEAGGRGAERYAMLKVAIDLAVEAVDDHAAHDAIAALAAAFTIDAWHLEADTLLALAKRPAFRMPKADLAARFSELADDALQAGNFKLADELAGAALVAARKSKDADALRTASTHAREVAEVHIGYEEMAEAQKTLASDPSAPAANAQLGRFTCFLLGDWRNGLRMLKLSDDATLRPLAEREAKVPLSVDETIAIGDQWWALADKQTSLAKRNIRRHSAELYGVAIPELDGLARIRVKKRLDEIGIPFVKSSIAKSPVANATGANAPGIKAPLAEGPQFPAGGLLYHDDFSKPDSIVDTSRGARGVSERGFKGGRYYLSFDSGDRPYVMHQSQLVPWPGGSDFALRVTARVVGSPSDVWDVAIQSRTEEIEFGVALSSSGRLEVAPTAVSFKQEGPRSGPLEPAAVKRGQEFNSLLLVAFKQKAWVFLNGVLQSGPLELPDAIFPAKVRIGLKTARGIAEFKEISVWSVSSFPDPPGPK